MHACMHDFFMQVISYTLDVLLPEALIRVIMDVCDVTKTKVPYYNIRIYKLFS